MGIRYIVTFNEHMNSNRIRDMVSSMAVGANVFPDDQSERTFMVYPLNGKPSSYLEDKLMRWDVDGFIRWLIDEISN